MSRIGTHRRALDDLEDLVKSLNEAESNVEMLNQQIAELQGQIISFNLKGDFEHNGNMFRYDRTQINVMEIESLLQSYIAQIRIHMPKNHCDIIEDRFRDNIGYSKL